MFGDLEADPVGFDVELFDELLNLGCEVPTHQLSGGDVDPHLKLRVIVLPLGQLADGLTQHGVTDLDNETALLGCFDECSGGQETSARVLPSEEGLDGADLTGVKVDLWLVVQGQLAAIDGLAKFDLDFEPVEDSASHLLIKDGEAFLAMQLCLMQCCAGLGEQLTAALL